jgi:hypothetical protein
MICAFISVENVGTLVRVKSLLEEGTDGSETLSTVFIPLELDRLLVTTVVFNDDLTLVEVDVGVVDEGRRHH